MKKYFQPLAVSFLLAMITGCSLISPSSATPSPTPSAIPPSSYEPQPADAKLERGQVYLDLESSRVVIRESLPAQVSLVLNGSLSTPCHKLRVVVSPADPQKEIRLEVYSVFDPKEVCITVIQPFNATIPLGSYTGGHYTVYVNDQPVGEFDT
jgi:hypothetical protein